MKYYIQRTMFKDYIYRINGDRVERRTQDNPDWIKSGLSTLYVVAYLKEVSTDDAFLEMI